MRCKFHCTQEPDNPRARAKSSPEMSLRGVDDPFRPRADLAYEHMFPHATSPQSAAGRGRLRSAIALAAAALTLLDDSEPPDWRLPPEFLSLVGAAQHRTRPPSRALASDRARPHRVADEHSHPHPHRLSPTRAVRRAGAAPAVVQPCLSPIRSRPGVHGRRLPITERADSGLAQDHDEAAAE